MAFDQQTRNSLQRAVARCRTLLQEEFTAQCQGSYGIQPDGTVTPLADLTAIDDADFAVAARLRERIDHLADGLANEKKPRQAAVDRVLREQAFTILNRFAALRMCEERGIVRECVRGAMQSKGFQLFQQMAGTAIGSIYERYRVYLRSVWDELSLDLGVLFDRYSPCGMLFPRENALKELLDVLNDSALAPLWAEDETIGWIYQYWNSKEERKAMRDASAAPRNSRELAVRNQFFTPRYVVEFLTDNTLGRIWYEMTEGDTGLKDSCRYLVRRPDEVFLGHMTHRGGEFEAEGCIEAARLLMEGTAETFPEFHLGREDDCQRLIDLAHTVDGYARYRLDGEDPNGAQAWLAQGERRWSGVAPDFEGVTTQALLDFLFVAARADRQSGGIVKDEHGRFCGAFIRNVAFVNVGNEVRRRVLEGRKDDASQEELLKQPVFIPYRPPKDPRTILMLDPACGSMHFGLYAFDLYERIYEEAWDIEEVGDTDALRRPEGMASVHESYASREQFLHDVPRLIIAHNIHGIDIDPRAVQIAGLSLWLRAQRAWQKQGLKPTERPRITKSNIVCAEPMPGERDMLDEFTGKLGNTAEGKVVARLVEFVWDRMRLAGEAGSLLKIEENLAEALAKAKADWEGLHAARRDVLPGMESLFGPHQPELDFAVAGVRRRAFWDEAETRVLTALRAFAETATDGKGFQRRLFADDAAQGFAFIDLCRQHYDVALMNPPFGEWSAQFKAHAKSAYPNSYNDILAAFVERGGLLLHSGARIGAITSRTCFFLNSFAKWRAEVTLKLLSPCLLADLGHGVMDAAMVEAAAYVMERSKGVSLSDNGARASCPRMETETETEGRTPSLRCFRLTTGSDKAVALDEAARNAAAGPDTFDVRPEDFRAIPGAPFAYWAGGALRRAFATSQPFGRSHLVASGTGTLDDFRFLRVWTEVPVLCTADSRWFPYAKGGTYGRYYIDQHLTVNWSGDGAEMKAWIVTRYGGGHWARNIRSTEHYFRPGLTWPRRSQKGLGLRVLPAGCVFADKGPAAFIADDDPEALLALLAVANSAPFRSLVGLQMAFGSYEVGVIQRTPVPELAAAARRELASLALRGWELKRDLDGSDETSHCFVAPVAINHPSIAAAAAAWAARWCQADAEMEAIQANVDGICQDLYGFAAPAADSAGDSAGTVPPDDEDGDETSMDVDSSAIAIGLVSWCLGVAVGRFGANRAEGGHPVAEKANANGGQDALPPFSAPFEPLGAEASRAGDPRSVCPQPGIMVDDDCHPEDIVTRVREAMAVVWEGGGQRAVDGGGNSPLPTADSPLPAGRADAIEAEACEILGVRDLREYFAERKSGGKFFTDHLKRYSKSRRQAPIYWPLSTASGSYTLWIYYHRLTDQTLFTAVNHFVSPKSAETEQDIVKLRERLRTGGTAKERDELDRLVGLRQELQDFRDELLRIAHLPYRPDLNDGGQITAAPLWRLFRHRAWQKTLQETWEKLRGGDYDWAHLALTIWPDRVVRASHQDRSYAIAHDLEDRLWHQVEVEKKGKGGKVTKSTEWRPRDLTETDLKTIVAEVQVRKQA